MKSITKDVLIRAGKTFWQAALASLVVAIPEIIDLIPKGWQAIKPVALSASIGALAAGLSAVYNGVIAPIINRSKPIDAIMVAEIVEIEENGGDSSVDEGE
jgi:hypothetical protein